MRRKEESTESSHGGSEVRRIHIIYFLCRHGNFEHPHLVRLHHFSRNGVRLKDVKRWLGELRGRDIAESYSWSYKRKYKAGYVWQDLVDDDLITPVSDNEYVLKGSEISSKLNNTLSGKQKCEEASESHSHTSETSIYVSAKEIEEEQSPPPSGTSETSTLTDESPEKHDEKIPESKSKQPPPLFSTVLTKKTTSGKKLTRSSSNANLLRNLITCGTVKTDKSALVPVNDRDKRRIPPPHFLGSFCNDVEARKNADSSSDKKKLQGFQRNIRRVSDTSSRKISDGVKNNNTSLRTQRYCASSSPSHRHCEESPFEPDKLQEHIRSCKGMKKAYLCN